VLWKPSTGTLLFGLMSAFLFAKIREVWDIEKKHRRHADSQRYTSRHLRVLRGR
jgi:hypothetical protein